MPKYINITFVDGERNGESISVPFDAPFTAGRDGGDAVRFREKAVSRGHFTVTPRGMRAEIVNNGKNPTEINGRPLAKGETCTAGPGDTLMVRYPSGKSGFRIDSITNGADDGEIAADSQIAADATVAYPGGGAPTRQTLFGSSVMVAEDGSSAGIAPASVSMNSVETAKDETRTGHSGFATVASADPGFGAGSAGYDAPTRPDAGRPSEVFERSTGPSGTMDPEIVNLADSPSGTGVTDVIRTRVIDLSVIGDENKRWERKKRTRRRLLAFAVLGFVAFIGAIVWLKWPKTERWLEWPVKPGAEKAEFEVLSIRGAAFLDAAKTNLLLSVRYPVFPGYSLRKPAQTGSERYEVDTYVGKNGEVPCHIWVERSVHSDELKLSPAESAADALSVLKKRFDNFAVYENVPGWGEGESWGFIEKEVPIYVNIRHATPETLRSRRGIKYYKCEYTRDDSASKVRWRASMIMFRRGDERYLIAFELPESEWARGMWLAREGVYPIFQSSFCLWGMDWESPGFQAIARELNMAESELLRIVHAGVGEAENQNWPDATRAAHALLAKAWADPAKAKLRTEAGSLWRKLEYAKEVFYNSKKNRFDSLLGGLRGSGRRKGDMNDIRDEVENAFKFDYGNDMRAEIVNDSEVWPCGKTRKKQ